MDKKALCELDHLLEQLKQGRDVLTKKKDCGIEEWQQEISKILPSKTRAQQIVDRLTEDHVKDMVRKAEKRRKMRLRKRRQLEGIRQEKDAAMRRRSQKHQEIDERMSIRSKEEEKKKQDAELQKEIDRTLSEVRRKKRELSQQQNLYRALRKLRQIRHGHGHIKVTAVHHEKFERGIKDVEEFVRQRSLMCREEERTMQVMLEVERDELRAQEDEKILRKKAKVEAARLKEHRELLFGEDPSDVTTTDGQDLISQFYYGANTSLQSFIDIRKQWDAHIVSSGGSAVPLNWVTPVAPSSKMWSAALADHQG